MNCFACGKGELKPVTAKVEGVVKKKKYKVETRALVCDVCGHAAIESSDMPEYMRKLSDVYRRDNGLYTSDEIKRIRGKLTQQKFAEELGVGVASLKRWELGLVQDRSNNNLIRDFAGRVSSKWAYEFEKNVPESCLTAGLSPMEISNSPPVCYISMQPWQTVVSFIQ